MLDGIHNYPGTHVVHRLQPEYSMLPVQHAGPAAEEHRTWECNVFVVIDKQTLGLESELVAPSSCVVLRTGAQISALTQRARHPVHTCNPSLEVEAEMGGLLRLPAYL